MELSEKILTLRRARGLSQEALAEKLQVSRQAVSRWENGTALPDASNILQLSKLFGVSADYLLNNDWEENTPMPETEPPAPEKSPIPEKTKPCRWSGTRIAGICMAAIGFCTNLVIYIASPRMLNRLDARWHICVNKDTKEVLEDMFGAKNVKVIQKNIEFGRKRY